MNIIISEKYSVEGGIDFYAELYKSLDVEENEHKTSDDLNNCLITNKPLTDNYIKLLCGHKFNYMPLYLDIKNHKQKFNCLEGSVNRLAFHEIRCPYCRNKQKELLPYYDIMGIEKVHGVNYIDPDYNELPKYSNNYTNYNFCQFLTVNPHYDPDGDNPEEVNLNNYGNCKFYKCFMPGYQIIGNKYVDDKYYCAGHKKEVIKSFKEQLIKAKLEAKDQAKKAKEEAKDQLIKAKLEAKKVKEDTKIEKVKVPVKKSKKIVKNDEKNDEKEGEEENKMLGLVNIVTVNANSCQYILKRGPNKGNQCSQSIYNCELCKRHYNSQNKQ